MALASRKYRSKRRNNIFVSVFATPPNASSRTFPSPSPREYLGRCRPKFSDPCRSWDVHRSATGRSRLSLLITALTYIRGACVAAEAAIHGERHACVESDSAPKKRNIASRARRDHLSLRSSRRAHERSWNTRCSLHAYLLELSYPSSPLLRGIERS